METKLWILSMDGGGVRSYSSLLILQYLLVRCWGPNYEAHNVFRVAYGTSGGGLCALMLARLQLNIDVAIERLKDVSLETFVSNWDLLKDPRDWVTLLLGRPTLGYLFWPKHPTRRLKTSIEEVIDPSQPMEPHSSTCQSYVVCSWRRSAKQVKGLRLKTFGNLPLCPVSQAGLATSAAPTFFNPVEVQFPADSDSSGPRKLQDGGIGNNNPIKSFEQYEKSSFKSPANASLVRRIYVSIGTGKPPPREISQVRNFWRLLRIWNYPGILLRSTAIYEAISMTVDVATDTENAHEFFQQTYAADPNVRYFRFNCEGNLTDIALDDVKSLERIKDLTEDYLESSTFKLKRDSLQDEM